MVKLANWQLLLLSAIQPIFCALLSQLGEDNL
jgi:hypothetical protein